MDHRGRGEKESCKFYKRQDLENNLIISVVDKNNNLLFTILLCSL